MKNVLITICARGGSKGIPKKNIRKLNGKPLIAYTIAMSQKIAKKYNANIALSTDSEEIKEVAKKYGLTTRYDRPEEFATDKVGKINAIQHVMDYSEKINKTNYDYIIDLDVTSPMRTIEDIAAALEMIESNSKAVNIFSVSPAARNPYFNMVEETSSGFVQLVKGSPHVKSRQEAPKVYDMNASFYIFRKAFFNGGYEVSTTDRSLAYEMPHVCFDLDEPHDFIIMELMLRENLIDLKF